MQMIVGAFVCCNGLLGLTPGLESRAQLRRPFQQSALLDYASLVSRTHGQRRQLPIVRDVSSATRCLARLRISGDSEDRYPSVGRTSNQRDRIVRREQRRPPCASSLARVELMPI